MKGSGRKVRCTYAASVEGAVLLHRWHVTDMDSCLTGAKKALCGNTVGNSVTDTPVDSILISTTHPFLCATDAP